jgi:hypothetical protein
MCGNQSRRVYPDLFILSSVNREKETKTMSKQLETVLISLMIALALGPILAVYSLIIYPIV